MNKNRVPKTIYFTPLQVELGEKKATSMGMVFSDWIKYLLTKEIEPLSEYFNEKKKDSLTNSKSNNTEVEEFDKYIKELINKDEQSLPY